MFIFVRWTKNKTKKTHYFKETGKEDTSKILKIVQVLRSIPFEFLPKKKKKRFTIEMEQIHQRHDSFLEFLINKFVNKIKYNKIILNGLISISFGNAFVFPFVTKTFHRSC